MIRRQPAVSHHAPGLAVGGEQLHHLALMLLSLLNVRSRYIHVDILNFPSFWGNLDTCSKLTFDCQVFEIQKHSIRFKRLAHVKGDSRRRLKLHVHKDIKHKLTERQ